MTAADYDWNTKEIFLKTQEHDNFKNNWCRGITLIRIPYTHLSTLTINDLLENSRFKI